MGGCVVISDKAQHTRKWALSWARYRQRDTPQIRGEDSYGSTRVGHLIHNGGLLVYLEGGREEIIELSYGRGVCGTIE